MNSGTVAPAVRTGAPEVEMRCARCGRFLAYGAGRATIRPAPCARCGCRTVFILQPGGDLIAYVERAAKPLSPV